MNETDRRFVVRKSRIPNAGNGLFAKVSLRKGDQFEAIGTLVRSGSISDQCTRFADQHKFRVGGHLLIPMGYGGMAAHSLKPNMEKVFKGKRLYLRALRDIKKGEELTHCYNKYAQARFKLK